MKVYTIYYNEMCGFTTQDIDDVVIETENIMESEDIYFNIPRLKNKVSDLEIGESCGVFANQVEVIIVCQNMSDEDYKNMNEWCGW